MQNLSEIQKRYKRAERIFLIGIVLMVLLMTIIVWNEIKEASKPIYKPKKIIVVSDEWQDNFDSTYLFNGCIHYTHKLS